MRTCLSGVRLGGMINAGAFTPNVPILITVIKVKYVVADVILNLLKRVMRDS